MKKNGASIEKQSTQTIEKNFKAINLTNNINNEEKISKVSNMTKDISSPKENESDASYNTQPT